MALPEKTRIPLQQRVNSYLRSDTTVYAMEESKTEGTDAIFDMLRKAETDLKEAQQRVDRLKWELAKVQS